jgi:quercetin dioxygenase-like cupin family protein
MHATSTIDYALILEGELWLELDDGKTVHFCAGDIVVQQATRHGWRNKGQRPATIVFFRLGSKPDVSGVLNPPCVVGWWYDAFCRWRRTARQLIREQR